jgi:hypothetical protein
VACSTRGVIPPSQKSRGRSSMPSRWQGSKRAAFRTRLSRSVAHCWRPMSAPPLRGCAVLALLCLHPLRALTININDSDTHHFYGSAGSGGDGASIGWTIPFSVPAGLHYVTGTIDFHSTATATNPNPFNFDINNSVFLSWTPRVLLSAPSFQGLGVTGVTQSVGTTAIQGPHQSLSIAGTFNASLTLSGIIDLSGLVGEQRVFLFPSALLFAGTQYGGGTHTASINGTFTIERIPENGFTLPWGLGAIVAVLVLHRRINRSRPPSKVGAPPPR